MSCMSCSQNILSIRPHIPSLTTLNMGPASIACLSLLTCRQASHFQLVVEPYAWGRAAEGGQGPLLRLHTPTAAAAQLTLPAGRHLARLLTSPHSLHALDLRSNAPFQLEDLNKVCTCQSAQCRQLLTCCTLMNQVVVVVIVVVVVVKLEVMQY